MKGLQWTLKNEGCTPFFYICFTRHLHSLYDVPMPMGEVELWVFCVLELFVSVFFPSRSIDVGYCVSIPSFGSTCKPCHENQ